jgi:hypothetical protein
MFPLKARVENGRIKLDEATVPDGQLVELVPLDEVIATDGDELDGAERAALHRSIDESIADEEARKVEDLSKIIAELRAQRLSSARPDARSARARSLQRDTSSASVKSCGRGGLLQRR